MEIKTKGFIVDPASTVFISRDNRKAFNIPLSRIQEGIQIKLIGIGWQLVPLWLEVGKIWVLFWCLTLLRGKVFVSFFWNSEFWKELIHLLVKVKKQIRGKWEKGGNESEWCMVQLASRKWTHFLSYFRWYKAQTHIYKYYLHSSLQMLSWVDAYLVKLYSFMTKRNCYSQ